MKKILILGGVFLAVIAVGLYKFGIFSAEENVRKAKNVPEIQAFKEIDLAFEHKAHEERFPFLGGAVIDVEGDGKMEIFISGSKGQNSALYSYQNGQLTDISSKVNLNTNEAAFGAVSIDIDNDTDVDLIVGQQNGVWLYNNDGGRFIAQKISVNSPKNSFPLGVATGDINKDGLPDLYISHFVSPSHFKASTFNNPDHAKSNILLLNTGNRTFRDITRSSGTAGNKNTFHSTFVDLNNDGYQDLVLANNTGALDIFENKKNLTFSKTTKFNSGLGYWMSLSVGDFDKDGDQDLFFSNIGSSIPKNLVRGDLKEDEDVGLEWLLLRNEGDFNFTDVTKEHELTEYGFGWGGVFEDINLDGELDLIVAQNYIKWPGHAVKKLPNKAFLQLSQKNQKAFYHVDELGLNNPYFGQSPLIVDIDNNGKPDVIWLNMAGPARAFLNQSNNNFLKVRVPDNSAYLGGEITVNTDDGQSYTRQIVASTGFGTDQTPNVFFGLGKTNGIREICVKKANGQESKIPNPEVNSTITLN